MRNLRKAALVAAMVGSFGLIGAGVASADASNENGSMEDGSKVSCYQEADETAQFGLINVANSPITLLGSGPNPAGSNQQICSGENGFGYSNAEGGEGYGLLGGLLGGGL